MQRKDTMLVTTTSRTLAIETQAGTVSVLLSCQEGCDAGDHGAGAALLVRFALMQLLPMLWFRSQASLAASTMTGARSHRRNWDIRCRLRSLAMLGLLAGVLSLVLLRLLLLALPVLRCCRMAG